MKILRIILVFTTVLLMAALMSANVFAESEAPADGTVAVDGENTVRDYKAISPYSAS